MANQYEIQLDSIKTEKSNVRMDDVRTHSHIQYIFGSQKFDKFDELSSFKHRALTNIQSYDSWWSTVNIRETTLKLWLQKNVNCFAAMIQQALNFMKYDIEICYNINTEGLPVNDRWVGSTYRMQQSLNSSGGKLIITLYIQNINSLKQIMELIVHDVAHAMCFEKPFARLRNLPTVIGDFDINHDDHWQSAAVMLVDTICMLPVAEHLYRYTVVGDDMDFRNDIDVTTKVGHL